MEHKNTQEKLKAWMDINAVLEALISQESRKPVTESMVLRAMAALQIWGAELEEQTKHLEPEEMADEKR